MNSDYLYESAPLVEVIAEIHWNLKPVSAVPTVKIDPYFDVFRDGFIQSAEQLSLTNVEEIIPSDVPLEILPHQPRLRLRKAPGTWPLAQIGPGILTANIVPPYQGWREFRAFLKEIVSRLFASYPLADRTLKVEKLHLRYIDGFGDEFRLRDYLGFAEEMLGIASPFPGRFIQDAGVIGSTAKFVLEYRFSNVQPADSTGLIRVAPGKLHEEDALILETHCEGRFGEEKSLQRLDIETWFDEAHARVRRQFDLLATATLKEAMGPRKEIVE